MVLSSAATLPQQNLVADIGSVVKVSATGRRLRLEDRALTAARAPGYAVDFVERKTWMRACSATAPGSGEGNG